MDPTETQPHSLTVEENVLTLTLSAGLAGEDGASAYEIAVANGFSGTEEEWLASLVGGGTGSGEDGASAYEIAVANGFSGTEEEWLASLVGEDGFTGYENPVDYGADPTGVADSAQAIQDAIDVAITKKTGVIFPAGTYLLTAFAGDPSAVAHLLMDSDTNVDADHHCDFIGTGKVILKSEQANAAHLKLSKVWKNNRIENITFLNTSVGGTTTKIAIYPSGQTQNGIFDLNIQNCTFSGFSRAIFLNGATRPRIHNNTFLAPNGRDGGTSTNSAPNVFIWSIINNNGSVIDASIQHNTFDGYSGRNGLLVDAPSSQACMDGSTYGSFDGGIIANNIVRRCQYEPLAASRIVRTTLTTKPLAPLIISNNSVDGDLPANCQNPSTGDPVVLAGWGLRVDGGLINISDNVVKNCLNGIYCATAEEAYDLEMAIIDNVIRMSPDYESNSGIFVSGDVGYTATDFTIEGNQITYEWNGSGTFDRAGIQMARVSDVQVRYNTIRYKNFTSNASFQKQGIWFYTANNVNVDSNIVEGCDYYAGYASGFPSTDVSISNPIDRTLSGFIDGDIPEWMNLNTDFTGPLTLDLLGDGSVIAKPNEDGLIKVRNTSGSPIAKGAPLVYVGTEGASGKIEVANWVGANVTNVRTFLGFAAHEILNGQDGYSVWFGELFGIDTDGGAENWQDGQIIYAVGGSIATLTNVEPTSGDYVTAAVVVNAGSGTSGILFARPTFDRVDTALQPEDVVDDPTTGGTDVPASAEQVKLLWEALSQLEISDIQGLIDTLNAINALASSALQPEDVVNDSVSGGVALPASAEQVKLLWEALAALEITDIAGLTAALAEKAATDSLAAVAFSGSYDDLGDPPTLPSSTQVEDYLVDDGIHMITSSANFATPDANNGRSQKFELTENATLNTPTNLADGQSMLITVQQGAGPYALSFPAYFIMGGGVASDIFGLATGEYAWLSISRYGTDYLISITTEA